MDRIGRASGSGTAPTPPVEPIRQRYSGTEHRGSAPSLPAFRATRVSPQVARRSSMRDIDHSRRPARLVALMAGVTLLLGACNGGGSHKSAVTTTGNQATTTRAAPRPVDW